MRDTLSRLLLAVTVIGVLELYVALLWVLASMVV
jgi:hypothetical protein